MTYTNNMNIHPLIASVLSKDDYDYQPDAISVTTLINPAFMWRLRQEIDTELTVDVSTRLWAALGTAFHAMVAAGDNHYIHELRLSHTMLGRKITGKFDVLDPRDNALYDVKVTSKYGFKNNKPKREWIEQLNILRFLCEVNGITVKKLGILAIARDFMWVDTMKHEFGDHPFQTIPIPLWSMEETRRFITEKLGKFNAVENLDLCDIEVCTPFERWNSGTKYALMKRGALKASRIYDNVEDANRGCMTGYYIEERIGSDRRCQEYCDLKPHCKHGRSL